MRTNRCGHVTGQVLKGVVSKLETGATTTISSWSSDLAKLNLKCHMNYSIIFTDISFYSETSSLFIKTTLCIKLITEITKISIFFPGDYGKLGHGNSSTQKYPKLIQGVLTGKVSCKTTKIAKK